MCMLFVENVFVINTPDTPPVTCICYIPALQGVEKTCSFILQEPLLSWRGNHMKHPEVMKPCVVPPMRTRLET